MSTDAVKASVSRATVPTGNYYRQLEQIQRDINRVHELRLRATSYESHRAYTEAYESLARRRDQLRGYTNTYR